MADADPGHGGRRCGTPALVLLGATVAAVFAAMAAPREVSAAGRVALVVGNETYARIGRLPNPGNDAGLTSVDTQIRPLMDT